MALQGVLANPKSGDLQPEELADLVQRIIRAMLKPRPPAGSSHL